MNHQDPQRAYLLSQRDVDRLYMLIEYLGGTLQDLLSVRCHDLSTEQNEDMTPHEQCFAECTASIEADIAAAYDNNPADFIPY